MEIHSAEEAKKRFDSLPQEIKNILYSPEMAFAIQQVGQKNKLHLDQIDFLNTETGQVMLGFVDAKDFPNEIADNLNISKETAVAIAKDVDEMLFSKIRDAMKKTYEASKGDSAPTPPPPAPKPATATPPLASILPKTPPTPPPAPPPAPVAQAAPAPVPPAPKPPTPAPDMTQANTMLSQKTVDVSPQAAKPEPPKPGVYKTDPYREPAE